MVTERPYLSQPVKMLIEEAAVGLSVMASLNLITDQQLLSAG